MLAAINTPVSSCCGCLSDLQLITPTPSFIMAAFTTKKPTEVVNVTAAPWIDKQVVTGKIIVKETVSTTTLYVHRDLLTSELGDYP